MKKNGDDLNEAGSPTETDVPPPKRQPPPGQNSRPPSTVAAWVTTIIALIALLVSAGFNYVQYQERKRERQEKQELQRENKELKAKYAAFAALPKIAIGRKEFFLDPKAPFASSHLSFEVVVMEQSLWQLNLLVSKDSDRTLISGASFRLSDYLTPGTKFPVSFSIPATEPKDDLVLEGILRAFANEIDRRQTFSVGLILGYRYNTPNGQTPREEPPIPITAYYAK